MAILSKLQNVAQRILDFPDDVNIDMENYCSLSTETVFKYDHACGTTYCAAGYLAHEDNYPEDYRITPKDPGGVPYFDYGDYAVDLIGFSYNSPEWKFLFHPDWPDSLGALKIRAEYVLEHGTCPKVRANSTNHYIRFEGFMHPITL